MIKTIDNVCKENNRVITTDHVWKEKHRGITSIIRCCHHNKFSLEDESSYNFEFEWSFYISIPEDHKLFDEYLWSLSWHRGFAYDEILSEGDRRWRKVGCDFMYLEDENCGKVDPNSHIPTNVLVTKRRVLEGLGDGYGDGDEDY